MEAGFGSFFSPLQFAPLAAAPSLTHFQRKLWPLPLRDLLSESTKRISSLLYLIDFPDPLAHRLDVHESFIIPLDHAASCASGLSRQNGLAMPFHINLPKPGIDVSSCVSGY